VGPIDRASPHLREKRKKGSKKERTRRKVKNTKNERITL
jgi:hypothetical protein